MLAHMVSQLVVLLLFEVGIAESGSQFLTFL
jgi:hypothetical protein